MNVRKTLACVLTAAMLLAAASVSALAAEADTWDGTASQTWYGDGSADTFTISTAADLAGLAELVNNNTSFEGKTISLATDIDLAGKEWTPIGLTTRSSSVALGKNFKGTFLGNEHTISGLKITQGTANQTIGLFGNINNGTIRDLTVANVDINVPACENAGGIVGMMTGSSTIENCHVSGTIAAHDAGGIAARMVKEGTITGCTNAAAITGTESAAGIVAKPYYSETGKNMLLENCTNTGAITSTGYHAGGIAALSAANVQNCTNSAVITAEGNTAGGIVAEQTNCGTVSGCENTAAVNGTAVAGGIVGWIRYQDNASYTKNEIITVTGNTNSGVISNTKTFGSAGIVGETYNAAVITNNINTAPSINGYKFVAGITILTHDDDNLFYGDEESYLIRNNVSTTPEDQLTLKAEANKDLFVYNNLGSENPAVTIADNGTAFVAQLGDGRKFTTLQAAVAAAGQGQTVALLEDVALTQTLSVPAEIDITLDLAGKTITIDHTNEYEIRVYGKLRLIDSNTENPGKITCISGSNKVRGTIYVHDTGVFVMDGGYITGDQAGVVAYDKAQITINSGKIDTEVYAVTGNGGDITQQTTITINGGELVTPDSTAIYHPQPGTLNIHGGLIQSATGIEMRTGTLNIDGGKIVGLNSTLVSRNSNDGNTVFGPALVISKHITDAPLAIHITGGEFDGLYAIYEENHMAGTPQPPVTQTTIDIQDGVFKTRNGGTEAIYSQNITGFVTGGTFSSPVAAEYCAEGFAPVDNGDGTFGVSDNTKTVKISADAVDAIKVTGETETTGKLRFITKVDKLTGTATSFGTYILPLFVFEHVDENWSDELTAVVTYTGKDIAADQTYAADLTGIPEKYFGEDIVAQSFMVVDGETVTSDLFNAVSVDDLAQ